MSRHFVGLCASFIMAGVAWVFPAALAVLAIGYITIVCVAGIVTALR